MPRIAVVSDIHGNRMALEAVIRDLGETSPDLVLHGGDLADTGSSPVEVIDRIRALGWRGVAGNTDEMLYRPQALADFAARSPGLEALFTAVGEMASAAREALGEERLAWLESLPRVESSGSVALVHASVGSLWRAPAAQATDAELASAFQGPESAVVVYGHIHTPFVRKIPGRTIANAGSAGLPYDGDPRASYLVIDTGEVTIRRVAYDVAAEIRALRSRRNPRADWVCRILQTARPQMP